MLGYFRLFLHFLSHCITPFSCDTSVVLCFLRPVNFGIFATVTGLIYPKDAFGLFTESKLADAVGTRSVILTLTRVSSSKGLSASPFLDLYMLWYGELSGNVRGSHR
jgi:hypothetical protein